MGFSLGPFVPRLVDSRCRWEAAGAGEPCWPIPGGCAGRELGPAFPGAPHCLWPTLASRPPGISLLFRRAGERPELCRVSLPEFQQFLLEYQGVGLGWGWARVLAERGWAHHGMEAPHMPHPPTHQELWAVDRLQVQEFMLSFLRDPLREIEEPYFFLDEVSPAPHPPSGNQGADGPTGARPGPSRSPSCPRPGLSTLSRVTLCCGPGQGLILSSLRICSWAVRHLPVLQGEQHMEFAAGRRVPRHHEQPPVPLLDLLLAQHVSGSLGPHPTPGGGSRLTTSPCFPVQVPDRGPVFQRVLPGSLRPLPADGLPLHRVCVGARLGGGAGGRPARWTLVTLLALQWTAGMVQTGCQSFTTDTP